MRIAIVGSGFAGAILARVALRQGHEVALVERGRHPRFAIGESATPLAAIVLERLAERYGLDDLRHLAAYGRWLEHLPEVRRGLKRGFTFYRHLPGAPFRNDAANSSRLLVAASPSDAVADSHWLRADVDHYLVQRAVAEGAEYWDETEIETVEPCEMGFAVSGSRAGRPVRLSADFLVDGSGPGGFAARHLGVQPAIPRDALATGLVFGHFEGVCPLEEIAGATGVLLPPGPYPERRAAVHHLLDEGWMYELPFDHGVVSAGFVVEHGAVSPEWWRLSPEAAFEELCRRYPTIGAQYAEARPVVPIARFERVQRRVDRAVGRRWALLPHAYMFWSPLFSTGIAWSLRGLERLALIFESAGGRGDEDGLARGLRRYEALLRQEDVYLRRLVEAAYRVRRRFAAFDAIAQLYFVAASYCEARERLCPPPPDFDGSWAWMGCLGSTDEVLIGILDEGIRLVQDAPAALILQRMAAIVAPRNVANLANPERLRLYPVDLERLVASAALLGLSPEAVRVALPRLRGGSLVA